MDSLPDQTVLAYLAGIMDADGSFMIKRSTYHMRVRGDASCPIFSERLAIKQVTPDAIDLLHKIFGGSRGMEKPSAIHGQMLHRWGVTDLKAYKVALALFPYLRIKKSQASLLLELRKAKQEPRTGTPRLFNLKSRWGNIIKVRRRRLGMEQIAHRQRLFEMVKALNDTRSTQPKLG